jgi:drug/metabolite transporter (DMT)-like permease
MTQQERRGLLYMLCSAAGYSFFSVWVKNIQSSGLVALDIGFWRFLFASLIFWLVIRLVRLPAPKRRLPRLKILAAGSFLAAAAVLAFLALERLPVATAIVLFYTFPAMVAVASLFLGERLSGVGWAALAMTLIGIILTVPDFGQGLSGDALAGVVLALLNALAVTLYYLVSSRLLRGQDGTAYASAWSVMGSFLPLLVLALFRPVAAPADGQAWLNMMGLVVVSTVMPVFFLNMGIQVIGPARSSIIATLEPVLTLIWATLFLGERLLPIQVVGGALILASVLALQLYGNRRPASPAFEKPITEIQA